MRGAISKLYLSIAKRQIKLRTNNNILTSHILAKQHDFEFRHIFSIILRPKEIILEKIL